MTGPLAYLGPEGSFTHQAAQALAPAGAILAPMADLATVLAALAQGDARYAVAAIDSAAGPIRDTVAMVESGGVQVLGEHVIDIRFDLYRATDDARALVGVLGHDKALAQLSDWITACGLKTEAVASNTAGLSLIAAGGQPGWGAVGPPGLSALYGVRVEAEAVQAPQRLATRFVLLQRGDAAPQR